MIQPVPISLTDAVAWLVIGLFLGGWAALSYDRNLARVVTASAWVVFGVFWLLLIPRFALAMKSPIETVLSALAVPACLYAGYLLWQGRESLFTLSHAVAIMGVLYLPFTSIELLGRTLIETVARQSHGMIQWAGFDAALVTEPETGYNSMLVFTDPTGHQYVTHIVLQCTGIGSMSIFAGLIAAIDASTVRKVQALLMAVVVIYILNLIRNVFIAVAFGQQWFQYFIDPVMTVTGFTDPGLVSFFIADRVISQSASVVALVGITLLIVRIVPELLSVVEDAVYVVTRTEVDLHAAFATDGGR